jgi:hypothetical protein
MGRRDYWLAGRRPSLGPSAGHGRGRAPPEAAEAVEVVRALRDSWEDDADIRDVASSRYLNRDRLHYVDFAGTHYSVKGPAIVPRPPQGQVVVLAAAGLLPGQLADVSLVSGADLAELRAAAQPARRLGPSPRSRSLLTRPARPLLSASLWPRSGSGPWLRVYWVSSTGPYAGRQDRLGGIWEATTTANPAELCPTWLNGSL